MRTPMLVPVCILAALAFAGCGQDPVATADPAATARTLAFDKAAADATGSMPAWRLEPGASTNLPANAFVRDGWVFAGWATNAGGAVRHTNRAAFVMGSTDTALYAAWDRLPGAATDPATSPTGTGATCNGQGTPYGSPATGWFRFAASDPGTPDDVAGTRVPASGGAALGDGSSAVPYTQAVTGLTPGATYYCWTVVSNAAGRSFGSVVVFSPGPAAPAADTGAATAITTTTAALNGSGTPNAAAATGWFRLSASDPGSPSDTFGVRFPSSGGSALGSGTAAVTFSQDATVLAPNTTYYYCAVVQNAQGTTCGPLRTFKTAATPAGAGTAAATLVTATSATLNGSGNPNGTGAGAWFRYSTTDPGTPSDTTGTRAPVTGATSLGNGSSAVAFSRALTGLVPGTTYYCWSVVTNAGGTTCGPVVPFTVSAAAPAASTGSATALAGSTATLNGSVTPCGSATTAWFRYASTSPGTANDTFGTRAPASGGSACGAGSTAVAFALGITGLTPGTTYYYCAIAQNALGTAFGALQSFRAAAVPATVTTAATPVGSTTATMNGNVNPNGAATTGWFRYSTTNPGTGNDSFGTRAPSSGGSTLGSGTTAQAYAQSISGLAPNTTYYYCAVSLNAVGTSYGAVLSFTTQP